MIEVQTPQVINGYKVFILTPIPVYITKYRFELTRFTWINWFIKKTKSKQVVSHYDGVSKDKCMVDENNKTMYMTKESYNALKDDQRKSAFESMGIYD